MDISSNFRVRDLASIIIVLSVNPVVITFFLNTITSLPDTFLYLAQAQNIYNNFQFHTGAWGHVDTSVILPPFYPFMISLLLGLGFEPLSAGILLSQISGLVFSVIAFFYIKSFTNRIVAISGLIAIQLTYIYFNFSSIALTESLFLAILTGGLLLTRYIINNFPETRPLLLFMSGIVCSLALLCREIGITLLFFIVMIIFFSAVYKFGVFKTIKHISVIILGFSILTVPYYTLRAVQTDEGPLARNFRLGNYVVETEDRDVLAYIQDIRNNASNNYIGIYKNRRELMKLMPDGSEMLSKVVYKEEGKQGTNVIEDIINLIVQPEKYTGNFIDNLFLLKSVSGPAVFFVFVFLSATPLLVIYKRQKILARMIIPVFIIIYLLTISLFTSQVARYIEIIVPFMLMHVCIESFILLKLATKNIKSGIDIATFVLFFIFPVIVIADSPRLFYEKKIFPYNNNVEKGTEEMKRVINGDPVFAQFPVFAYMVGGQYRQLPNDRINKIGIYADKTGVRWLLIVDVPEEREIMQHWSYAYEWLSMENPEQSYPDLIKYCCGFYDKQNNIDWKLYSFSENGG